MLNKRKALIGYGVYAAGKPLAKRAVKKKVRGAAPRGRTAGIVAAVVGGLAAAAAAVGGLRFWRRRRSGGEESGEA